MKNTKVEIIYWLTIILIAIGAATLVNILCGLL